jgi:hypothetical protein
VSHQPEGLTLPRSRICGEAKIFHKFDFGSHASHHGGCLMVRVLRPPRLVMVVVVLVVVLGVVVVVVVVVMVLVVVVGDSWRWWVVAVLWGDSSEPSTMNAQDLHQEVYQIILKNVTNTFTTLGHGNKSP